jgi:hypothetical protein
MIAVANTLGLIWWFIMLFNYSKNELELKSNNTSVFPIVWSWGFLSDPAYGFTAAAYLASFVSGLFVTAPELAFYILSLVGETEYYGWYTNSIGYWGSIFLMPISPLLATLQLMLNSTNGGLNGNGSVEFGSNAIYIISLGFPIWFNSMAMHLVYGPRNLCYAIANPPNRGEPSPPCPLDEKDFDTPEAYLAQCEIVQASLKAEEEEGARSAESDEAAAEKTEGVAW